MIFTLYYTYATIMQWWRLRTLKNKLNGTLNTHNSLIVCCDNKILNHTRKNRSLENLLFSNNNKIACTLVPKLKLNLNQWLAFPKNLRYFPIFFDNNHHFNYQHNYRTEINDKNYYVLLQALFENYQKHQSEIIQIENFGELIGWRVHDYFEIILKTDIDSLTKLIQFFSQNDIDINHELQLLKIETVDIEGQPTKIKYEKQYLIEETLKYSYSPIYWKKFVNELKGIYSKIRDITTPKIKIENGSIKSRSPSPLPSTSATTILPNKENDVLKSPNKKLLNNESSDKNMLDVASVKSLEHRRHNKRSTNEIEKTNKSITNDIKTNKTIKNDKDKNSIKNPKLLPTNLENDSKKINKKLDLELQTNNGQLPEKLTKEKEIPNKNRAQKKESEKKSKTETELEPKLKSTVTKEETKKIKEPESKKKRKLFSKSSKSNEKSNNSTITTTNNTASTTTINGSSGSTMSTNNIKPPNVLVYADSVITKENVKKVLNSILNKEKYTIYDFPTNPTPNSFNSSNTILIVVCGSVPPNLTSHIIEYFLNGGQLLCLCSDLMHILLHTFTTAEVREHELVHFSYGKWEHVRMMHHIFCYQASPAKKQFSKDSDQSNNSSSNGSSPLAYHNQRSLTPNNVEFQYNNKIYNILVQILGTEETWHTPSLLLARVKNSNGKGIFSQVHLEIDPILYENDDEEKYQALKDSDYARLAILKDILSNRLYLDCVETIMTSSNVKFTIGYFLGRYEEKMKFLKNCENIIDNKLISDKITANFYGNEQKIDSQATEKNLPILINSCPTNFSTVNYFETLSTKSVGRLVIYSDLLTSSQFVLNKKLIHGLVVIPLEQVSGIGRSNNSWLSPIGCAAFSLQLHIANDSILGRHLPLIQHLIIVAIINSIKKINGYEELNLGIKWPNDFYANGTTKIGGIVVNSIIESTTSIVNIGCGINLNNSNPTICLNELITNLSNKPKPLTLEQYFGTVFNEIENLLEIIQNSNSLDTLFELYYKYWLHTNSDVTIEKENGDKMKCQITGIDEYGYLTVRLEENGDQVIRLQPDGNTFDMMQGLIAPKIH